MSKLTKEEKKILDNFKKSIPKLSQEEKSRALIFSEAVSIIADKNLQINT